MVLGAVRAASGVLCTVDDLCAPGTNPCTLSTTLECDSPASFHLGDRALVIAEDRALRVTHGDGSGSLDIEAASVTLQKDAFIKAQGDDGNSGFVTIASAGPVTIAVDAKGIDVSADSDGGFIDIEVQHGNLDVLGLILAKASNGDGGQVILTALDGSVTLGSAGIHATAPDDFNGGGSVDIEASADVSLLGPIDLRGGDGGDLTAGADGSVVMGADADIEGSAKDKGGEGASVELTAGGDVRLSGRINASAPNGDDENGGGFGGDVSIETETGSVEIGGELDVRGSKPDGLGGGLEVNAGLDLTVSALVHAGIDGGGSGGEVTLKAAGRTSIASILDVRADGLGGVISIETGDALTVQGTLLADATGAQGTGGQNVLSACTLVVVHGAAISATGAGVFENASNHLVASGEMTISGTLTAGDRNVLEYRDTQPAIVGAAIDPDEELVQNPALSCCSDACAPPTTTSTSTTSTSTTTLLGSTSTTTAPPGTSTTTTTTTTPRSGSTSTSSTAPVTPPTTPPPTMPLSCLDQPLAGFDVVDCHLGILAEALSTMSPDVLGGAKPARALSTRISQARRLVAVARQKSKPVRTLQRAKKQLKSFRTLALRGKRQQRITGEVADRLLGLAGEASVALDQLRTSIRPRAQRAHAPVAGPGEHAGPRRGRCARRSAPPPLRTRCH
jgi:hypothetical protein